MNPNRRGVWPWRPVICGLLAAALAGCHARSAAPANLVPDSARARWAVGRAMELWKAGRPTGVIEPTEPRIQVVDSNRKAGQVLEDYRILAETSSLRERTLSVRVRLRGPDEEAVVRYLVMGADPILVFRQEDYDLMMHWEHKMDPEAEDAAPGPEPPAAPRRADEDLPRRPSGAPG
ncbi:hypothetical protein OJF2_41920 [Aquisphaera giovannonii]|uniref:Uncharacterized protein n=1 Tax=Aquisphaera giovannonii TaxID=406548 RepID=A0A5B9W656_9BACT|nr:hypothetical protein [Aquisphaera giovannonii]QEH35639.1 hypothetical protein OJF2_41920 [Aquisphaera giovannonii]